MVLIAEKLNSIGLILCWMLAIQFTRFMWELYNDFQAKEQKLDTRTIADSKPKTFIELLKRNSL